MINLVAVKRILSALIDVPVENIPDDASMDDLEQWDSLAQMNLVIALEDEFGVSIPDEEVGTMVSLPLVMSLLDEITNL